MAGRYGNIDYPKITKRGVLFGLGLFLIGAVGEAYIHMTGTQVPGWEERLLLDLEFLGTAIALVTRSSSGSSSRSPSRRGSNSVSRTWTGTRRDRPGQKSARSGPRRRAKY